MKSGFVILFSAFFLASGLQLTIDRHYCGGTLNSTLVSFTGERASCGMEHRYTECNNYPVFGSKCCEDRLSQYALSCNFMPEYFYIDKPFPVTRDMVFQNIVLSRNNLSRLESGIQIYPPGENLPCSLTCPETGVFRI
jgi:hypothetical protein